MVLININENRTIHRPCNYDLNMMGRNNVPLFPIWFTEDSKIYRIWKLVIRRNVDFLMYFLHVRYPLGFNWIDQLKNEDHVGLWEGIDNISLEFIEPNDPYDALSDSEVIHSRQ